MLTKVLELRDFIEARLEAAKRTGKLLQVHADKICADENWQMGVTDERGLVLFVIYVHALRSPPTSSMDQHR